MACMFLIQMGCVCVCVRVCRWMTWVSGERFCQSPTAMWPLRTDICTSTNSSTECLQESGKAASCFHSGHLEQKQDAASRKGEATLETLCGSWMF